MNRSPTIAAARFSSLLPAPIHPMQARLLALVAAHRFATTTQLARLTALEYASSASALRQTQRHLASLAQQRLLTSLERRVGGWQGGSAVTIWAATTRGQRLVAVDEGEKVPRRQRPREVSTTFLDHLLAITEVRTSIEEAVRQEADTEAAVALEPDCWRTALSPSGQPPQVGTNRSHRTRPRMSNLPAQIKHTMHINTPRINLQGRADPVHELLPPRLVLTHLLPPELIPISMIHPRIHITPVIIGIGQQP